ncbi:MAG: cytochrome P450 [Actinophytocola sp.]|uniref:cytochrome P450 n=1 Tax=Actinophytocola sp. TaxID=1872138 RepID=UPI003D6A02F8
MTALDETRAAPGELRVPPGPPRSATFRLLRQLAGDRLTLMSTAAATYGDAVKVGIGPKTLYFFNHPDTAKHVLADNAANYEKGIGYQEAKRALGDGLLTSAGELWRKQRRTIQPVFQNKRITGQAGVVAAEAERLIGRLRGHVGGAPVDVLGELTGFTLGVLGTTLLDADLGEFDSIGHSFEAVQDQAMFEMESMGLVPQWLPLPKQRRFRRARRDLDRIVAKLVFDRLAEPRPDGDDVLTRLIQSTSAEADPKVARRRMRDELITLLLAGHETTASTIGWTLHLIDEHPEVGERLRAEAFEVLGDRAPTHEDMVKLPYTAMVLHEAMRLFPPVWILTRRALDEDVVGGYRVPAGADVMVCPYTLHRHPSFWDRPDAFDPDRFDPAKPADRPRYAYLPFGAGPRFCVGSHLGLMEATFVLAMISRELRLTKVPGYEVVAEPMLSLRVRGSLPMTVRAT